jgi:hypothetical protein
LNEQEYRSPSPAETTAELERRVREAVPGISDADLAAKTAELRDRVAWTLPQAGGGARELLARPGVAATARSPMP